MAQVVKKVESTGNRNILLTERGTSFGYNTLVSDFRSLSIMRETGYPVVFDATHSVQQPGRVGDGLGRSERIYPAFVPRRGGRRLRRHFSGSPSQPRQGTFRRAEHVSA